MKLGSLFDGIGGFPLAATYNGIEPVWASEIEPFPIEVTKKHFPNMKHLGDITQINGAEIEPVDIITFGSPCTRLSVAGRHDGFDITFQCEGTKEQPHQEYANKVRATDKYQYIYTDICAICGKELTETNESALFFHAIRIIGEMREATNDSYPRVTIWENVPGAFSSNGGQDFKSVLEEITESEIPMPKSGKWANAGMVRGRGRSVAWRVLDAQYWGVPQRRKRIFLVADFAGQRAGEILFEREGVSGDFAESGKAREKVAACVREGAGNTIGLDAYQHHNWRINDKLGPLTTTSCATVRGDTPLAIAGTVSAKWAKGTGGPAGDECQNLVAVTQEMYENHSQDTRYKGPLDVAQPVTATYGMGGNNQPFVVKPLAYTVRRLTPVECLRLQGYPDWWFDDIPGYSDTKAYKACGNSVAVPCVAWVEKRVKEVIT